MMPQRKAHIVLGIVTVCTLAMVAIVLALELRFGTAPAWRDGVQLPELLAVFVKTCGVLHAFPIIATGLVATIRAASHAESSEPDHSLYGVYLGAFVVSITAFSFALAWWY